MRNPLRRNERRTWGSSAKFGRLGVTGAFASVALLVILIVGWLVDRRDASGADQQLAALVRSAEDTPEAFITRVARAHRIVFLSDIHNSIAVKHFAARAIAEIARSSRLDAVVLEVGEDQQPYIDQYFDRAPENAAALLSHPKTLREPGAATRAYLDIYHMIWRINEKLGPDQRIRVIAADLPGWPLSASYSPAEIARAMDNRSAHMEQIIHSMILERIPSARVLVFMTGFNALTSGTLSLQSGGSGRVSVTALAERLAGSTDEAYSILTDAAVVGVAGREVAPYAGTRVAEVLRKQGVRKRFALTITSEFDYLRRPLVERKTPGIEFGIQPRDYKLRDVADGYINLGN